MQPTLLRKYSLSNIFFVIIKVRARGSILGREKSKFRGTEECKPGFFLDTEKRERELEDKRGDVDQVTCR